MANISLKMLHASLSYFGKATPTGHLSVNETTMKHRHEQQGLQVWSWK